MQAVFSDGRMYQLRLRHSVSLRVVMTTTTTLAIHFLVINGQSYDSTNGNRRVIRIGYLATEKSPPYRWGAMNLALQQGQVDGLLTGYNFSIWFNVTADTCDVKSGMFATMHMLGVNVVDVLFGPTCSPMCASVAYVTSYYNVPHFPGYCAESTMDDKTTYNTLIRIAGSWRGMGIAFAYILQTYGWNKLVLLTDAGATSCFYGGTAINDEMLLRCNVTFTWIRMQTSPTDFDIEDYLNQVKGRSRNKNMTNGDYAWFTFYPTVNTTTYFYWTAYNMSDEDRSYRIKAFYAVKQVTFLDFSDPDATVFLQDVSRASASAPWYANTTRGLPSIFAAWLYDSVYLYMKVADKMLRTGYSLADVANGTLLFQQAINAEFDGKTGSVLIDSNGDRVCTYTVWTYGPGRQRYYRYMKIDLTKQNISGSQVVEVSAPVSWGILGAAVPSDTPKCGLMNELCPPPERASRIAIYSSVSGVLLLAFIITAHFVRSSRNESKIRQMLWKLDCRELHYSTRTTDKSCSAPQIGGLDVSLSSIPIDDKLFDSFHVAKCKMASYRGSVVAVYPINKVALNLTRQNLIELISLKELNHNNIETFIGACIEPGHMCYVMSLCSRGTVQDLIADTDIKLDWLFRLSLISDLINGMRYIHSSVFQSHGRLTSAKCHIDSRWVLKIGGFGLDAFYETCDTTQRLDENICYRKLLWTAPELLRMKRRPLKGTKKGDVYSFAIIVQEIAYRSQPYFIDKVDPKLVVESVSRDSPPHYRPVAATEESGMPPALVTMMKQCWSQQPADRPSFHEISKMFRQVNNGKDINIVDSMLQKLEKYANNLQELVQQRTSELEEEKLKTDLLLYRMLPKFIADELKAGRLAVPQLYTSVTIYFSDIVGFTTLASQSSPMEVVELLNDLYGTFDDVIARHDVFKVETIGDAYMVVSGLPKPNGGRHIREICNMALNLLNVVSHFVINHRPADKLKLRIGIHTGPCAAGVVGHVMPRYCLFGDTVNVASRMESTGEALRIHMSESAHKAIAAYEEYVTEPRGEIFVKGKGMLSTFWLLGKNVLLVSKSVSDCRMITSAIAPL